MLINFLLLRINFYHILCPLSVYILYAFRFHPSSPPIRNHPLISLSLENKQVRPQLYREDLGVGEQLPRWTAQFWALGPRPKSSHLPHLAQLYQLARRKDSCRLAASIPPPSIGPCKVKVLLSLQTRLSPVTSENLWHIDYHFTEGELQTNPFNDHLCKQNQ